MIPIEEMRKRRFEFLHKLFELTGGDEFKPLGMFELGEQLGLDKSLTIRVARYLSEEQLVLLGGGGGIRITHWGIKAVEDALSRPEEPTNYFPPVVNIISIDKMIESQIQQAGPQAKQVITISEGDYGLVKNLVESLQRSIDELQLEPKPKRDLQADLQTIEAQMSASKPKPSIITECLVSIRRILEEAAGSALAAGFIMTINGLLGS